MPGGREKGGHLPQNCTLILHVRFSTAYRFSPPHQRLSLEWWCIGGHIEGLLGHIGVRRSSSF